MIHKDKKGTKSAGNETTHRHQVQKLGEQLCFSWENVILVVAIFKRSFLQRGPRPKDEKDK